MEFWHCLFLWDIRSTKIYWASWLVKIFLSLFWQESIAKRTQSNNRVTDILFVSESHIRFALTVPSENFLSSSWKRGLNTEQSDDHCLQFLGHFRTLRMTAVRLSRQCICIGLIRLTFSYPTRRHIRSSGPKVNSQSRSSFVESSSTSKTHQKPDCHRGTMQWKFCLQLCVSLWQNTRKIKSKSI